MAKRETKTSSTVRSSFFFFEKKSPSLSHGVLRSIIYSHVYYCYFRLGFGYVCVQSSHLVLLFLL